MLILAGCMRITFIHAQEMIVPITTRIRDAYKAGDKKTANNLGDDHRHRCELHLRVHHQGERQD